MDVVGHICIPYFTEMPTEHLLDLESIQPTSCLTLIGEDYTKIFQFVKWHWLRFS